MNRAALVLAVSQQLVDERLHAGHPYLHRQFGHAEHAADVDRERALAVLAVPALIAAPGCPLRTMPMEPHLTQASAGSSREPVPNMSSYTMERSASIARRRSSSSSNASPSRTPLTSFAALLHLLITPCNYKVATMQFRNVYFGLIDPFVLPAVRLLSQMSIRQLRTRGPDAPHVAPLMRAFTHRSVGPPARATTGTISPKTQTASPWAAHFQHCPPRWSALWAQHRRRMQLRHQQSGNCTTRGSDTPTTRGQRASCSAKPPPMPRH